MMERDSNEEVKMKNNERYRTHTVYGENSAGYVMRIDHQRIPQQAVYWEVPAFRRSARRPWMVTNWKGTVRKDLTELGANSPGKRGTVSLDLEARTQRPRRT